MSKQAKLRNVRKGGPSGSPRRIIDKVHRRSPERHHECRLQLRAPFGKGPQPSPYTYPRRVFANMRYAPSDRMLCIVII